MAKRNSIKIFYAQDPKAFWRVPYSNGKGQITLNRTEQQVRSGKRGVSIACMNANCIRAHADEFSHPVHIAAVTKSMAYVVDKIKNGVPVHAIRYRHNDYLGVKAHDKEGGREWLIKSGQAEFALKLRKPADFPATRRGKGKKHQAKKAAKGPSQRQPRIPYGAMGRAMEAGLINPGA